MAKLPDWTHARFEWTDTDAQLRAVMRLTHKWVDPAFDELWDEIGQRPGDADGPDQADLFYDETGGLWPADYNWLLHSLLVRDAVSAFEVYLEKAADEVLRWHHLKWQRPEERSPEWKDLVKFYRDQLAVEVASQRIREIRRMRHILTHQRGELRTRELRKQFGGRDSLLHDLIRLSEDDVTAILNDLASVVHSTDAVAIEYVDGIKRLALPAEES